MIKSQFLHNGSNSHFNREEHPDYCVTMETIPRVSEFRTTLYTHNKNTKTRGLKLLGSNCTKRVMQDFQ